MSLEDKNFTPDTVEDDIIDISMNPIRKKRFRIDGDINKMLELNVSDMNIITRLREGYPELLKLLSKASDKVLASSEIKEKQVENPDEVTDEELDELGKMSDTLKEIDKDMREWVDYIFNSNVSEVCASDGSMYDPMAGKFRFEHIIEILSKLYETNMDTEFQKLSNRVEKHTSKYHK